MQTGVRENYNRGMRRDACISIRPKEAKFFFKALLVLEEWVLFIDLLSILGKNC